MRVDNKQFKEVNKKLFQDGRWYLFLDADTGVDEDDMKASIAHSCEPLQKEEFIPGERTKSQYDCCLVIRNDVCRNCNDPVPEDILALQVLYNGEYPERRATGEGGYFG